jgi:integrase
MPAAAKKIALTDRSLQALRPAADGKRYTVWDGIMPGLAVLVSAKGKRTFYAVRRRAGDAQPTWAMIGAYPLTTLSEARVAAREALSALMAGQSPSALAEGKRRIAEAAAREAAAGTFAAVAGQFNNWYKITPGKGGSLRRRASEIAAIIDRELIPVWGPRPIADIATRDVMKAIQAIIDRGGERPAPGSHRKSGGPYAARHAFAAARLVFGWAFRRELIPADPCARIDPEKDLHGSPAARDRVLTDDELRGVWAAADATPYPYGPLLKLLILTGARLSEIAKASTGEIDDEAATLTVPTDRMKMKIAHVIPLTTTAMKIIGDLPRFTAGDFLFSTTSGELPVSAFSKFKTKFDETVRQVRGAEARPIPAWQLHDLRRTCRTALSSLGVQPVVAEMVIGHQQQGVVAVYDLHRYDSEKRQALTLWETRLLSIVTPEPEPVDDKVVELPKRARA